MDFGNNILKVVTYLLQINKTLIGIAATLLIFSQVDKVTVGEYLLLFYLATSISAALSMPFIMHVARTISRQKLFFVHKFEVLTVTIITICFYLSEYFGAEKYIGTFLIAIVSFLIALRTAYFNINRERLKFSLVVNIFPLIRLLLLLCGLYYYDDISVDELVSLTVLAALASYIVIVRLGLVIDDDEASEEPIANLMKYMMLASLLWTGYINGEKFIVSGLLDLGKLAEYMLLLQLTYLVITNFLAPLIQLYYPMILRNAGKEPIEPLIIKLDIFIISAASIYLIALSFFIDYIITIINEEYLSISEYFWVTTISGAFFMMGQIRSVVFSISGYERYHLYTALFSAIFGITGAIVLIDTLMLQGAIYSSLLYSLAYLTTVNYFYKKSI